MKFYNQKSYQASLNQLKSTNNSLSLEYRGLCYLQLRQYDFALASFKKLSENDEILQNKGLFYQAIVLIKIGKLNEAKIILGEIETNASFFGKAEAQELKKLME